MSVFMNSSSGFPACGLFTLSLPSSTRRHWLPVRIRLRPYTFAGSVSDPAITVAPGLLACADASVIGNVEGAESRHDGVSGDSHIPPVVDPQRLKLRSFGVHPCTLEIQADPFDGFGLWQPTGWSDMNRPVSCDETETLDFARSLLFWGGISPADKGSPERVALGPTVEEGLAAQLYSCGYPLRGIPFGERDNPGMPMSTREEHCVAFLAWTALDRSGIVVPNGGKPLDQIVERGCWAAVGQPGDQAVNPPVESLVNPVEALANEIGATPVLRTVVTRDESGSLQE
ncbi:hypothetical protein AB0N05_21945 [Nocardia sp. NPDC051030]|uniref:hypothetical protein n=1 Tax=Nocardia sp. NPDC051030 TaxID=3155162 RepID=UPI003420B37C